VPIVSTLTTPVIAHHLPRRCHCWGKAIPHPAPELQNLATQCDDQSDLGWGALPEFKVWRLLSTPLWHCGGGHDSAREFSALLFLQPPLMFAMLRRWSPSTTRVLGCVWLQWQDRTGWDNLSNKVVWFRIKGWDMTILVLFWVVSQNWRDNRRCQGTSLS
jgi:hypothetical protein